MREIKFRGRRGMKDILLLCIFVIFVSFLQFLTNFESVVVGLLCYIIWTERK